MPTLVNGEPILEEWIEQESAQIKAWHEQHSQVSCCERDEEFRSQAKENVIGRLLLHQAAEKDAWQPSEQDINQAVDKLHAEHGGEEAFRAATGMVEGQETLLREQVLLNLKMDHLLTEHYQSIQEPSQETLQGFHQDQAAAYTTPGRVRALHIFKSMRQATDRESLFRECCEMRRRLLGGEDFMTLARTFSDKPPAEIDLGFFKRGELMDEFEFVAFSMQKGEISPVFSSYHGFHLAKVVEVEPESLQPFDSVIDQVTEDWWQQARERALGTFVAKLRADALIQEQEDPPVETPSNQTQF